MKRRALRSARLLVFACAVLAYATACFGTFLYDDVHSVRDNTALQSLANVPRLLVDPSAFSALDAPMWRPVLLLTFAVNHAMGHGAALPYKLTDILLHALTALALASVARALGGSLRASTVAAALFAVHPLASEAVNFVSARSDQLLVLGALLALRAQLAAKAGRRVAWLGVAAGTVLACGAKETGALVPVVLIAVDAALGLRAHSARAALFAAVRRALPALIVVVAYLVARRVLLGQATVAMPRLVPGDVAVGGGRDLVTQFCVMAGVLPRFLAQSLLPIQLTPDPPLAMVREVFSVRVLLGWGLVLAATAAGLFAARRRPLVFAGTVLAWAIALPWVLVPLNAPAGEHRFYGSLAGLALVAAGLLHSRWLRTRRARLIVSTVGLAFAVHAALLSLDFRSEATLWARAAAVDPQSVAAFRGLAQIEQDAANDAAQRGDQAAVFRHLRAAVEHGERALSFAPTAMPLRRQLLRIRLALGPEHGAPLEALAEARALVERRPRNPHHLILLSQALTQAGTALGERRFLDEAEATALACLKIAEPRGLVWRVAAEACVARGDLAAALAHFDAAAAAGFATPPVRLDRADLLRRLGRDDEARQAVRSVLVELPFDARARQLAAELAAPPR